MTKLKPYPCHVCMNCGKKYGKFPEGHMSTFHENICDVCGKKTSVTEPRDFGYPIFPNHKTA